ncbi:hypothetical protein SAMN05421665_1117 [Yoonia rosea]|uniref:Uncharacterized protein n=1 Tax=Yoonia rosea TaxID=287098 RepID=A0A1R3WR81_9RHOB|nr:hypothetical protein SAMN05421665_1117 [Yoonia rosea]
MADYLFKTVLVILGQSTTQPVDDHKDYGRRENSPYDNQQKFHEMSLASGHRAATPAGCGCAISAELVPVRPYAWGIFAHIPSVLNALCFQKTEVQPC